jgi:hypothetical protein
MAPMPSASTPARGGNSKFVVIAIVAVSIVAIVFLTSSSSSPPPASTDGSKQQQQHVGSDVATVASGGDDTKASLVQTASDGRVVREVDSSIVVSPPRRNVVKGLVNKSGVVPRHVIVAGCDEVLPEVPLSPLEQELRRILEMTVDILRERNLVGWPADGTLLGLVRNGRVMTDRDIDFNIHSTYTWCSSHLHSLKSAFEKRTKIRMFKVVHTKRNGQKIGRYAMVRMPPVYGTFGTGVDLNCVYEDDAQNLRMHVHSGTLEVIPAEAFPLGFCLGYGLAIPCPRDPMAVLDMFRPRYDGCMVFPHCTGDPRFGTKKCLSPHPPLKPRRRFLDVVEKLDQCGWVSLKRHASTHASCAEMLEPGAEAKEQCGGLDNPKQRWPICFLQGYKD